MNKSTDITTSLPHTLQNDDGSSPSSAWVLLLSSALNRQFVSASAWGLDKYSDFEMPYDMLSQSWPTISLILAVYLLMVYKWNGQQQQKKKGIAETARANQRINVSTSLQQLQLLDLPTCRHAWNTCLALYSIMGAMHMVSYLLYQISTLGFYAAFCGPHEDSSFDKGPVGFWFLLFVLGKVVELGDTLFLMASGRTVIFLHWYHHATILPCCFYALQAKIPMLRACASINYTVHAVMYSYFALNDTSLLQNTDNNHHTFRYVWAQRITTLQCTQFVICLAIVATGAYDRLVYHNTDIPYASVVLAGGIFASYLYLFLQFAEEKYAYRSQLYRSLVQLWLSVSSVNSNNSDNRSQTTTTIIQVPWHRSDFSLERRFQEATKMVAMMYGSATEQDLQTLYGCYKQARVGPIPKELIERPEPVEKKARTKLQAWKAVQGLTVQQAQEKYIAIVDVLHERTQANTQQQQIRQQQRKSSRKRKEQLQSSNDNNAMTVPINNTGVLYPVRIAGHGRYLPRQVVSTKDIERMGGFELSSQEKKRTGVEQRHFCNVDGGENLVQNGAQAIRAACAKAGILVEDLDLIIGGFGGHQVLPDDASLVQRELGLGESGIRAFTVHATCLSFLVGMEVAGSFMTNNSKYQKVAVFASSISSVGLYKKDPHTAGLFGDGAAAVILEPSNSNDGNNNDGNNNKDLNCPGIHGVHMETYGCGADTCRIQGGGNHRPHHHPNYDERMSYFEMDGKTTLSLVSKYAPAALHNFIPGLERGLDNLQIPGSDKRVNVDWVVPHQASAVALDSLSMFGWPEEKILKTLHKYGNCVAASIPLTLCDGIDNNTIKRGDRVLLCGTSAGLSCASMLLTY